MRDLRAPVVIGTPEILRARNAREFRLLESDPQALVKLTHHDYMERGGAESVEMIMWLAMRSALGDKVRRIHRHYYAPMLTGYGLIVFEGADA